MKIKEYIQKRVSEILGEAIPLRKAIELTKGWDKNRLSDWFGGKYRVYLPLIKQVKSENLPKSDIQKNIEYKLENTDYELIDYKNGIVKNKKYNRDEKLGKVLTKMNEKDLLNKFNTDKQRENISNEQPIVVVSRHPYDIAGMSTDRGWTSCKDLGTSKIYGKNAHHVGSNASYIKDEIHSLLIAYLINKDDKNIKYPIARVLIVPYMNNQQKIGYVVSNKIYGTTGSYEKIFIDTIQKWLDTKQGILVGLYKINPFVYQDNMESNLKFIGKSELPDWINWNNILNINFEWNHDKFIWKNGTWKDGYWKYGIWKDGTWWGGIWEDGVWEDGTRWGGIWEDGVWEDGVWEDGTWYGGIWKDGTRWGGIWEDGVWEDGVWKNGIWKGGVWEDGIWEDGVWEDGVWEDGTWKNGTWENGTWKNGIWKDGTWKNGTWKNGTWKNGIWKGGKIFSDKYNQYIESRINPNKFKKLEKESKTIEELKNNIHYQ